MSTPRKTKIKIFDKDYTLLVDNEDKAKRLGEYVNNWMNELKNDLADQPTHTVAVLASLNIANEKITLEEEIGKYFEELTNKVQELNKLVVDVLNA